MIIFIIDFLYYKIKKILVIEIGNIKTNQTIKKELEFNTMHLGSNAEDEQVKLKATVSPKKSSVKGVKFTSSNKKVATVSSKGVVTGKKKGTAKITVKSGSKSVKVK